MRDAEELRLKDLFDSAADRVDRARTAIKFAERELKSAVEAERDADRNLLRYQIETQVSK